MEGVAAGLGAMAFWAFLAAVVVAGIWYSSRERETQHETLRRIIESGQAVDEALVDRVFRTSRNRRPDRDLRIAGAIVLSAAFGLAMLGLFVGVAEPGARLPMYGIAALVASIGIGLFVASWFAGRGDRDDEMSESRTSESSPPTAP